MLSVLWQVGTLHSTPDSPMGKVLAGLPGWLAFQNLVL